MYSAPKSGSWPVSLYIISDGAQICHNCFMMTIMITNHQNVASVSIEHRRIFSFCFLMNFPYNSNIIWTFLAHDFLCNTLTPWSTVKSFSIFQIVWTFLVLQTKSSNRAFACVEGAFHLTPHGRRRASA